VSVTDEERAELIAALSRTAEMVGLLLDVLLVSYVAGQQPSAGDVERLTEHSALWRQQLEKLRSRLASLTVEPPTRLQRLRLVILQPRRRVAVPFSIRHAAWSVRAARRGPCLPMPSASDPASACRDGIRLSPPVGEKCGGVVEDRHRTSKLRIRPVTAAPQRNRANSGSACRFNVVWRIPDHHGLRPARASS
jgi:hypothetical protein